MIMDLERHAAYADADRIGGEEAHAQALFSHSAFAFSLSAGFH
jgi:hypothetical protein